MKIIDILDKKANGTLEDGFKFKYNYETFAYENEEIIDNIGRNIGCLFHLDIHLNDEVEVIKENKAIEELDNEIESYANTVEQSKDKINELVRAINKLIKESEEK